MLDMVEPKIFSRKTFSLSAVSACWPFLAWVHLEHRYPTDVSERFSDSNLVRWPNRQDAKPE